MIKKLYEETVVNMISNPDYVNLSFYGFLLAKCKVSFNKDFPTLGVNFKNETFNLMIGDWFTTLSKKERMAVLIHEMRHIIMGHIWRKGERDHQLFNIAADIAINQTIENLPADTLLPETFDFPKNESAETYYELLLKEKKKQEEKKANGDQDYTDGKPDLTESKEYTIDVHDWADSENTGEGSSEELGKLIVEKMVKDAVEQHLKVKGNLSQDITDILEMLKRKPKISWKKELKKIIARRKGTRQETIKKRNRRFNERDDLRGHKRIYDKVTIIVGIDVSGSMNDTEILDGLIEIQDIVKNIGEVKVVQIDAEIKSIKVFNKKDFKTFQRSGTGGTYMGILPKYINENKEQCDALVMISDMYIEDLKTDENWHDFKKPVIWLSTEKNDVELPKKHKLFDISDI